MLIYVASPYTHPDAAVRQDRYDRIVENVAEWSLLWPHTFFSPIAATHPIAVAMSKKTGGAEQGDWGRWSELDGAILHSVATAHGEMWIRMLDGWEESAGIAVECSLAYLLKIPVTLVDEAPVPSGKERWRLLRLEPFDYGKARSIARKAGNPISVLTRLRDKALDRARAKAV